MLSAGTASLLPNSNGLGTGAQQQFLHAAQWEVVSENELSLTSRVDGHFPAILKLPISFHTSAECTAPAKDEFQSRTRQLTEERTVSAL
jgi:hypothetical protein